MRMAELERRTGVDREVIRILLREGLLPEPHRPARNAAIYDERHVRAVAAVRDLQRSSRLTLREIKRALAGEGLKRGSPSTYRRLEELLAERLRVAGQGQIPLARIAERFPKAERDAAAFAGMGMLTIVEAADGPCLSLSDARLVEIWGQIREAGFVEETGFPPENIAFYLSSAEEVAAREWATFSENSGGRVADEAAAQMLHIALPLMLDFFGILRNKAFLRNVHSEARAIKDSGTKAG